MQNMFMYNRAKYQVIWAKNKNFLKGGGATVPPKLYMVQIAQSL